MEAYNSSFPLIIDPWVTYFGDPMSLDTPFGVSTDNFDNAVFTGTSRSNNFPVSLGAFQMVWKGSGPNGRGDLFAVKMNADGTRAWATYYGGSGDEAGGGISTDAAGNTLVVGVTGSNDMPVGATAGNVVHQNSNGGGSMWSWDYFLFKLDPSGLRLWATYYGGTGEEGDYGEEDVATDGSNVYLLGGRCLSANAISTPGAYITVMPNPASCLVKFLPNGARVWGTYLQISQIGGIACDPSGNIYATTDNATGALFKLNPTGSLLWTINKYGWQIQSVACDKLGNVIIVGETDGSPGGSIDVTAGAYQTVFGGGVSDVFIIKYNGSGTIQWGTFLGGSQWEAMARVAVDGNNNIYVLGEFEDVYGNYPMSPCAYQPNHGSPSQDFGTPSNNEDQFIARYDPNGKQRCITYMGGTTQDDLDAKVGGLAVSGSWLYVTGKTAGGYPVTANAYQTTPTGMFFDQLCINLCETKVLGLNFAANVTAVCPNIPVTFTPTIGGACDTSDYKFKWVFAGGSPANSTVLNPSVTYSTPGTYPVKLVLTTACKKDSVIKASYIIVNNCSCVMSAATSITANVNCTTSGSAKATISNGSGGSYTYTWSNGSSGVTTASSIPVIGLPAGTYTVTVTDGSCISISTVSIAQALSVNSITPTNVSCNGAGNGKAIVSVSGGAGLYTYNWSNGVSSITSAANPQFNNFLPGVYTLTVTEGSCVLTSTVTITEPAPMLTGLSVQWSACPVIQATLTTFSANGSSPYLYSWSSGQTTGSISGLNNGTYSVTATDVNGCTASAASTVVNSPLTMNSTSTNNSCNTAPGGIDKTGSASVAVSGGTSPYFYTWNTGETGSAINGIMAGGYTVTVTDGNGCTITKTFNITGINPASAAFTQSPGGTICKGTTVNFTYTGGATGAGITHTWTIKPISPTVGGNTVNFSYQFLSTGTYDINHIVNQSGCTSNITSKITVFDCSGPAVSATGSSICPGICATVYSVGSGGTSPYTYSWSNGATTQNISPCPVSTTTYTVTIKDTGGNTSTSTAIVTVNSALTGTTTATNINCNGGAGSATATGGSGSLPYAFTWSNGQTTQTATALSAGNYTVTVTDTNGCTTFTTVAIIAAPPLIGQFTKGTANCAACGCKEWIMVTASGGTSPYSYSWPDGYSNRYMNHLCPGTYSINIKDKNGCSVNVSLTAP